MIKEVKIKPRAIIWLGLTMIILIFHSYAHFDNKNTFLILLGAMSMAHGIIGFIRHGNKFITPTGLFLLSSALLVGFSSVYITITERYNFGEELFYATLLGFTIQIIIYAFSSNYRWILPDSVMDITNPIVVKKVKAYGSLMLCVGFIGSFFNHRYSMFTDALFYVGVLVIVVLIWNNKKSNKLVHFVFLLILTTLLYLLYYKFAFDNFGRIVLATLALSILMGMNHVFRNYNIKPFLILLLVPTIIIASNIRENFLIDTNPYYSTSSDAGFGSIVSPLNTFGKLLKLHYENELDLKFGETFWSAIVVLFPREWWETKPESFGREITHLFRPELVSVGHSEASITYGEWLFNFGYTGLLLSVVFFIVIFHILDRVYLKMLSSKLDTTVNFIKYVILIMLIGGIINVFWGGFSTFMTRDGFRILILLLIVFPNYLFNMKSIKERGFEI